MIVSHKYRFIYIKNRKVGSTSAELLMQQLLGEDDISTPDQLVPLRRPDPLGPGARNWGGSAFSLRELVGAGSPTGLARSVRDFVKRPRYYNHMRASSVRARLPRKVWDEYYTFCFERNPWDKCVSFYYWFGRGKEMPEFNDFYLNHRAHGTVDQTFPTDWTRYTHRDRVIVDDVFDFADYATNIRLALERAGVPRETIDALPIPEEKTRVRKENPEIRPETDALIRKVFKHEIATFPFCAEPMQ